MRSINWPIHSIDLDVAFERSTALAAARRLLK